MMPLPLGFRRIAFWKRSHCAERPGHRSQPRRPTTLTALTLGALAAVSALPSPALADNPIVQTNYTADPAPLVHEGTLYLYTSHDEDVTVDNFYTMNDWRLYSTVDMVNWTDHGSPASYRTFSWGTGDAWAPQGAARNGEYYLYVPLNNATGARIGVGVSDNPAGPFMDPLGRELAASGSGNIDPTVFIDDDGQAYMYWGNATLRYVKLNSDMISYSGSVTNVDLNGFTEGPWLYKRESLYYLVYAAISGTEKISYATSDSPTGPWTVRGDIMAAGSTFTNHAGVVDYKGHSYFFYHNSALPGGGDFKRSVCVEEFSYGADGSIPTLTMSDEGPDAVATLNPFVRVEAETIAFSSGLKTEVCGDTDAGMNVTNIHAGDYIKVKAVDFLDGVTSFEARVSEASGDARIELHLDSQDGTLLGTCDVSGASEWATVTCPVSGEGGEHDLFLKFAGGGGELFKFNWWKFDGPTTSVDGADAGVGGAGPSDSDAGVAGSSGVAGSGNTGGNGSPSGGSGTGGNPAAGGSASVSGGSSSTNGGGSGTGGAVTPSSGPTTVAPPPSVNPPSGGTTPQPGVSSTAPTGTTAPSSSASASGGQPSVAGPAASNDGSCACHVPANRRENGAPLALSLLGCAVLGLQTRRRVKR